MSIANELSSEVAAAMLTREKDKDSPESSGLLDVVLEVHTTLQRMTREGRRKSFKYLSDSPQARGAAITGNH